MKKEEKKVENIKCEHSFLPVAYTRNLQVYGYYSGEELFLENCGFAFVECSTCDIKGYVLLN